MRDTSAPRCGHRARCPEEPAQWIHYDRLGRAQESFPKRPLFLLAQKLAPACAEPRLKHELKTYEREPRRGRKTVNTVHSCKESILGAVTCVTYGRVVQSLTGVALRILCLIG